MLLNKGQMKHVTWRYRQKCESLEVFSALLTLILSKTWWLFHTWEQKKMWLKDDAETWFMKKHEQEAQNSIDNASNELWTRSK